MKIHLSSTLTLPADAVTQKQAFLGISGSGKTYGAGVFVEGLLTIGAQVVILDVVGNWYGLRIAAKGSGEGFPIPVFGGDNGDIPLEPSGGAVIADAVVDYGISMVLDLHLFRKNHRKQFMTDFAEQLFHRKKSHKSPLHVVLEESQLYIPQKTFKGEERMLGAMEDLCKLGRNYGIGYSLISQRPQAVNKDVLNQTGTVYAFRMTGPQERKVMEGWLSEQTGDVKTEMLESLPYLENGECWVWSPQWLKAFKRIHIGKKTTFDASATPVFGAKAEKARTLAPVDLDQLQSAMKSTIEKAKAEDPKVLKAEIAKLQAELKKAQKAQPAEKVTVKEVPALGKHDITRLEDWTKKAEDLAGKLIAAAKDIREGLYKIGNNIPTKSTNGMSRGAAEWGRRFEAAAKTVPKTDMDGSGGEIGKGERIILTGIATYEDGISREGLTVLTGYKRSSRDTYLQRLFANGYIEAHGEILCATENGIAALGSSFEPLPTGDALQSYWLSRLSGGEQQLLRAIITAYPNAISREDLSEQTSYKRSSRDTYLQRLSARRLILSSPAGVIASIRLFD